jgi:hypothetical protein
MENNDKPGINGTPFNLTFSNDLFNITKDLKAFYIKFDNNFPFRKNHIIKCTGGNDMIVLKVYRKTKLKTFFNKLGFKFKIDMIKVKHFETPYKKVKKWWKWWN